MTAEITRRQFLRESSLAGVALVLDPCELFRHLGSSQAEAASSLVNPSEILRAEQLGRVPQIAVYPTRLGRYNDWQGRLSRASPAGLEPPLNEYFAVDWQYRYGRIEMGTAVKKTLGFCGESEEGLNLGFPPVIRYYAELALGDIGSAYQEALQLTSDEWQRDSKRSPLPLAPYELVVAASLAEAKAILFRSGIPVVPLYSPFLPVSLLEEEVREIRWLTRGPDEWPSNNIVGPYPPVDQFWIRRSDHDFGTLKEMFRNGKWPWGWEQFKDVLFEDKPYRLIIDYLTPHELFHVLFRLGDGYWASGNVSFHHQGDNLHLAVLNRWQDVMTYPFAERLDVLNKYNAIQAIVDGHRSVMTDPSIDQFQSLSECYPNGPVSVQITVPKEFGDFQLDRAGEVIKLFPGQEGQPQGLVKPFDVKQTDVGRGNNLNLLIDLQETGRDFWHLLLFLRTTSSSGKYPSQFIPILYPRDLINFVARFNNHTVEIVSNVQQNVFRDFMSSDDVGVILHDSGKDCYLQVEYYSQEEFKQVIDDIKGQTVVIHEVKVYSPLGVQETVYAVVTTPSLNINQSTRNKDGKERLSEAITSGRELSSKERLLEGEGTLME